MRFKSPIVIAGCASVLICAGIGIGAMLFNGNQQPAPPLVEQSKGYTGDGSLTKELTKVFGSYNKSAK